METAGNHMETAGNHVETTGNYVETSWKQPENWERLVETRETSFLHKWKHSENFMEIHICLENLIVITWRALPQITVCSAGTWTQCFPIQRMLLWWSQFTETLTPEKLIFW